MSDEYTEGKKEYMINYFYKKNFFKSFKNWLKNNVINKSNQTFKLVRSNHIKCLFSYIKNQNESTQKI